MKILKLLILVGLFVPVFAEENVDSTNLAHYFDKIKSKVKEKTLDNGLKIIVYERPEQPIFTAYVTIDVGGANEELGETGITHVLEHMAFKGTKTLGTDNFDLERELMAEKEEIYIAADAGNNFTDSQKERLEQIDQELKSIRKPDEAVDTLYAQLGGVGLNATTSADLTNYFVSMPNNAFEAWCQIESDRHLEPVWRDFYEERDVVLEEKRMRYYDNVDGYFYLYLLSQGFEEHPYRHPVIGYNSDIKKLTMTAVDKFYREHYGAKNFTITIIGGVDADEVFSKVSKYFGRLPAGKKSLKPKSELVNRQKTVRKTISYPASPRMAFLINKPSYPNADSYAIELWLEAKLGGITSPIYKKLVLDENIAAELDYFEAPGSAADNLMIIAAKPAKGVSLDQLEKIFLAELSKGLKAGVDKKRFEVVKLNQKADFINRLDSNSSLASGLSYSEAVFGNWRYYFSWLEQLNGFSPEQISEVARKYLDSNKMLIIRQNQGKRSGGDIG